jgi:hypothetical protein
VTISADTGWVGGSISTATRQQFIALINTVGSVHHAKRLMKHIIISRDSVPLDKIPDDQLQAWALRAADGEQVPPKIEAAVKKRLMGWEEWATREVIHAYRDAGVATADLAAQGMLPAEKQVQLKYVADGISMMTRDTAGAFGSQKPTQTVMNGITVMMGNRPPPKKLRERVQPQLEAPAIDAEFTEVTSGDSGS